MSAGIGNGNSRLNQNINPNLDENPSSNPNTSGSSGRGVGTGAEGENNTSGAGTEDTNTKDNEDRSRFAKDERPTTGEESNSRGGFRPFAFLGNAIDEIGEFFGNRDSADSEVADSRMNDAHEAELAETADGLLDDAKLELQETLREEATIRQEESTAALEGSLSYQALYTEFRRIFGFLADAPGQRDSSGDLSQDWLARYGEENISSAEFLADLRDMARLGDHTIGRQMRGAWDDIRERDSEASLYAQLIPAAEALEKEGNQYQVFKTVFRYLDLLESQRERNGSVENEGIAGISLTDLSGITLSDMRELEWAIAKVNFDAYVMNVMGGDVKSLSQLMSLVRFGDRVGKPAREMWGLFRAILRNFQDYAVEGHAGDEILVSNARNFMGRANWATWDITEELYRGSKFAIIDILHRLTELRRDHDGTNEDIGDMANELAALREQALEAGYKVDGKNAGSEGDLTSDLLGDSASALMRAPIWGEAHRSEFENTEPSPAMRVLMARMHEQSQAGLAGGDFVVKLMGHMADLVLVLVDYPNRWQAAYRGLDEEERNNLTDTRRHLVRELLHFIYEADVLHKELLDLQTNGSSQAGISAEAKVAESIYQLFLKAYNLMDGDTSVLGRQGGESSFVMRMMHRFGYNRFSSVFEDHLDGYTCQSLEGVKGFVVGVIDGYQRMDNRELRVRDLELGTEDSSWVSEITDEELQSQVSIEVNSWFSSMERAVCDLMASYLGKGWLGRAIDDLNERYQNTGYEVWVREGVEWLRGYLAEARTITSLEEWVAFQERFLADLDAALEGGDSLETSGVMYRAIEASGPTFRDTLLDVAQSVAICMALTAVGAGAFGVAARVGSVVSRASQAVNQTALFIGGRAGQAAAMAGRIVKSTRTMYQVVRQGTVVGRIVASQRFAQMTQAALVGGMSTSVNTYLQGGLEIDRDAREQALDFLVTGFVGAMTGGLLARGASAAVNASRTVSRTVWDWARQMASRYSLKNIRESLKNVVSDIGLELSEELADMFLRKLADGDGRGITAEEFRMTFVSTMAGKHMETGAIGQAGRRGLSTIAKAYSNHRRNNSITEQGHVVAKQQRDQQQSEAQRDQEVRTEQAQKEVRQDQTQQQESAAEQRADQRSEEARVAEKEAQLDREEYGRVVRLNAAESDATKEITNEDTDTTAAPKTDDTIDLEAEAQSLASLSANPVVVTEVRRVANGGFVEHGTYIDLQGAAVFAGMAAKPGASYNSGRNFESAADADGYNPLRIEAMDRGSSGSDSSGGQQQGGGSQSFQQTQGITKRPEPIANKRLTQNTKGNPGKAPVGEIGIVDREFAEAAAQTTRFIWSPVLQDFSPENSHVLTQKLTELFEAVLDPKESSNENKLWEKHLEKQIREKSGDLQKEAQAKLDELKQIQSLVHSVSQDLNKTNSDNLGRVRILFGHPKNPLVELLITKDHGKHPTVVKEPTRFFVKVQGTTLKLDGSKLTEEQLREEDSLLDQTYAITNAIESAHREAYPKTQVPLEEKGTLFVDKEKLEERYQQLVQAYKSHKSKSAMQSPADVLAGDLEGETTEGAALVANLQKFGANLDNDNPSQVLKPLGFIAVTDGAYSNNNGNPFERSNDGFPIFRRSSDNKDFKLINVEGRFVLVEQGNFEHNTFTNLETGDSLHNTGSSETMSLEEISVGEDGAVSAVGNTNEAQTTKAGHVLKEHSHPEMILIGNVDGTHVTQNFGTAPTATDLAEFSRSIIKQLIYNPDADPSVVVQAGSLAVTVQMKDHLHRWLRGTLKRLKTEGDYESLTDENTVRQFTHLALASLEIKFTTGKFSETERAIIETLFNEAKSSARTMLATGQTGVAMQSWGGDILNKLLDDLYGDNKQATEPLGLLADTSEYPGGIRTRDHTVTLPNQEQVTVQMIDIDPKLADFERDNALSTALAQVFTPGGSIQRVIIGRYPLKDDLKPYNAALDKKSNRAKDGVNQSKLQSTVYISLPVKQAPDRLVEVELASFVNDEKVFDIQSMDNNFGVKRDTAPASALRDGLVVSADNARDRKVRVNVSEKPGAIAVLFGTTDRTPIVSFKLPDITQSQQEELVAPEPTTIAAAQKQAQDEAKNQELRETAMALLTEMSINNNIASAVTQAGITDVASVQVIADAIKNCFDRLDGKAGATFKPREKKFLTEYIIKRLISGYAEVLRKSYDVTDGQLDATQQQKLAKIFSESFNDLQLDIPRRDPDETRFIDDGFFSKIKEIAEDKVANVTSLINVTPQEWTFAERAFALETTVNGELDPTQTFWFFHNLNSLNPLNNLEKRNTDPNKARIRVIQALADLEGQELKEAAGGVIERVIAGYTNINAKVSSFENMKRKSNSRFEKGMSATDAHDMHCEALARLITAVKDPEAYKRGERNLITALRAFIVNEVTLGMPQWRTVMLTAAEIAGTDCGLIVFQAIIDYCIHQKFSENPNNRRKHSVEFFAENAERIFNHIRTGVAEYRAAVKEGTEPKVAHENFLDAQKAFIKQKRRSVSQTEAKAIAPTPPAAAAQTEIAPAVKEQPAATFTELETLTDFLENEGITAWQADAASEQVNAFTEELAGREGEMLTLPAIQNLAVALATISTKTGEFYSANKFIEVKGVGNGQLAVPLENALSFDELLTASHPHHKSERIGVRGAGLMRTLFRQRVPGIQIVQIFQAIEKLLDVDQAIVKIPADDSNRDATTGQIKSNASNEVKYAIDFLIKHRSHGWTVDNYNQWLDVAPRARAKIFQAFIGKDGALAMSPSDLKAAVNDAIAEVGKDADAIISHIKGEHETAPAVIEPKSLKEFLESKGFAAWQADAASEQVNAFTEELAGREGEMLTLPAIQNLAVALATISTKTGEFYSANKFIEVIGVDNGQLAIPLEKALSFDELLFADDLRGNGKKVSVRGAGLMRTLFRQNVRGIQIVKIFQAIEKLLDVDQVIAEVPADDANRDATTGQIKSNASNEVKYAIDFLIKHRSHGWTVDNYNQWLDVAPRARAKIFQAFIGKDGALAMSPSDLKTAVNEAMDAVGNKTDEIISHIESTNSDAAPVLSSPFKKIDEKIPATEQPTVLAVGKLLNQFKGNLDQAITHAQANESRVGTKQEKPGIKIGNTYFKRVTVRVGDVSYETLQEIDPIENISTREEKADGTSVIHEISLSAEDSILREITADPDGNITSEQQALNEEDGSPVTGSDIQQYFAGTHPKIKGKMVGHLQPKVLVAVRVEVQKDGQPSFESRLVDLGFLFSQDDMVATVAAGQLDLLGPEGIAIDSGRGTNQLRLQPISSTSIATDTARARLEAEHFEATIDFNDDAPKAFKDGLKKIANDIIKRTPQIKTSRGTAKPVFSTPFKATGETSETSISATTFEKNKFFADDMSELAGFLAGSRDVKISGEGNTNKFTAIKTALETEGKATFQIERSSRQVDIEVEVSKDTAGALNFNFKPTQPTKTLYQAARLMNKIQEFKRVLDSKVAIHTSVSGLDSKITQISLEKDNKVHNTEIIQDAINNALSMGRKVVVGSVPNLRSAVGMLGSFNEELKDFGSKDSKWELILLTDSPASAGIASQYPGLVAGFQAVATLKPDGSTQNGVQVTALGSNVKVRGENDGMRADAALKRNQAGLMDPANNRIVFQEPRTFGGQTGYIDGLEIIINAETIAEVKNAPTIENKTQPTQPMAGQPEGFGLTDPNLGTWNLGDLVHILKNFGDNSNVGEPKQTSQAQDIWYAITNNQPVSFALEGSYNGDFIAHIDGDKRMSIELPQGTLTDSSGNLRLKTLATKLKEAYETEGELQKNLSGIIHPIKVTCDGGIKVPFSPSLEALVAAAKDGKIVDGETKVQADPTDPNDWVSVSAKNGQLAFQFGSAFGLAGTQTMAQLANQAIEGNPTPPTGSGPSSAVNGNKNSQANESGFNSLFVPSAIRSQATQDILGYIGNVIAAMDKDTEGDKPKFMDVDPVTPIKIAAQSGDTATLFVDNQTLEQVVAEYKGELITFTGENATTTLYEYAPSEDGQVGTERASVHQNSHLTELVNGHNSFAGYIILEHTQPNAYTKDGHQIGQIPSPEDFESIVTAAQNGRIGPKGVKIYAKGDTDNFVLVKVSPRSYLSSPGQRHLITADTLKFEYGFKEDTPRYIQNLVREATDRARKAAQQSPNAKVSQTIIQDSQPTHDSVVYPGIPSTIPPFVDMAYSNTHPWKPGYESGGYKTDSNVGHQPIETAFEALYEQFKKQGRHQGSAIYLFNGLAKLIKPRIGESLVEGRSEASQRQIDQKIADRLINALELLVWQKPTDAATYNDQLQKEENQSNKPYTINPSAWVWVSNQYRYELVLDLILNRSFNPGKVQQVLHNLIKTGKIDPDLITDENYPKVRDLIIAQLETPTPPPSGSANPEGATEATATAADAIPDSLLKANKPSYALQRLATLISRDQGDFRGAVAEIQSNSATTQTNDLHHSYFGSSNSSDVIEFKGRQFKEGFIRTGNGGRTGSFQALREINPIENLNFRVKGTDEEIGVSGSEYSMEVQEHVAAETGAMSEGKTYRDENGHRELGENLRELHKRDDIELRSHQQPSEYVAVRVEQEHEPGKIVKPKSMMVDIGSLFSIGDALYFAERARNGQLGPDGVICHTGDKNGTKIRLTVSDSMLTPKNRKHIIPSHLHVEVIPQDGIPAKCVKWMQEISNQVINEANAAYNNQLMAAKSGKPIPAAIPDSLFNGSEDSATADADRTPLTPKDVVDSAIGYMVPDDLNTRNLEEQEGLQPAELANVLLTLLPGNRKSDYDALSPKMKVLQNRIKGALDNQQSVLIEAPGVISPCQIKISIRPDSAGFDIEVGIADNSTKRMNGQSQLFDINQALRFRKKLIELSNFVNCDLMRLGNKGLVISVPRSQQDKTAAQVQLNNQVARLLQAGHTVVIGRASSLNLSKYNAMLEHVASKHSDKPCTYILLDGAGTLGISGLCHLSLTKSSTQQGTVWVEALHTTNPVAIEGESEIRQGFHPVTVSQKADAALPKITIASINDLTLELGPQILDPVAVVATPPQAAVQKNSDIGDAPTKKVSHPRGPLDGVISYEPEEPINKEALIDVLSRLALSPNNSDGDTSALNPKTQRYVEEIRSLIGFSSTQSLQLPLVNDGETVAQVVISFKDGGAVIVAELHAPAGTEAYDHNALEQIAENLRNSTPGGDALRIRAVVSLSRSKQEALTNVFDLQAEVSKIAKILESGKTESILFETESRKILKITIKKNTDGTVLLSVQMSKIKNTAREGYVPLESYLNGLNEAYALGYTLSTQSGGKLSFTEVKGDPSNNFEGIQMPVPQLGSANSMAAYAELTEKIKEGLSKPNGIVVIGRASLNPASLDHFQTIKGGHATFIGITHKGDEKDRIVGLSRNAHVAIQRRKDTEAGGNAIFIATVSNSNSTSIVFEDGVTTFKIDKGSKIIMPLERNHAPTKLKICNGFVIDLNELMPELQ